MTRSKKSKEARRAAREQSALDSSHRTVAKKAYNVSQNKLEHFEDLMDPTSRDMAEAQYLAAIADPAHAPITGVPLALGGIPRTSIKVRAKYATTMLTDATTGDLAIGCFSCRGRDQPLDVNDVPGHYALDMDSNLVPKYGKPDAILPNQFLAQLIVGGYTDGKLPAVGSTKTTTQDNTIATADPGISFIRTRGRLVAQVVEIFPAGPMLTTQGIGLSVVQNENGDTGLNDIDANAAYQLQNTTRNSFPLANWGNDRVVRFVRVPTDQQDLAFLPCDFSAMGVGPAAPGWETAGAVWAAFYINGGPPSMPVRVETTCIWEFVNSATSLATPNPAFSYKGPALAQPIGAMNRGLDYGPDSPEHQARVSGAVHSALVQEHGPKKATGFASILSKVGGFLGGLAKKAIPQLVGLATTALSDGLIPPQLGAGLADEAFSIADQISMLPAPPDHGLAPSVRVFDEDGRELERIERERGRLHREERAIRDLPARLTQFNSLRSVCESALRSHLNAVKTSEPAVSDGPTTSPTEVQPVRSETQLKGPICECGPCSPATVGAVVKMKVFDGRTEVVFCSCGQD